MKSRTVRLPLGYLLVGAAAGCWASGGLVARWLFVAESLELTPIDLSAARAVVAATVLLLGALAFGRSKLKLEARDIRFVVVFGIAGQALLHLSYYQAISLAGVAPAILLEYLAPVFVIAASVVLFGERPTWELPTAAAVAIVGCAMVVGVMESGGLKVPPSGVAWGLAAAALFAVYMLMGRAAARRMSAWALMTYGLTVAALFWTVVLGPARVIAVLSEPDTLVAVGYVAVVSTILPFGFFLLALRHIDAARAGIAATAEPVLAGVGAWVFLGEALSAWQVIGAGFVLGAIAFVQRSDSRGAGMPPGT